MENFTDRLASRVAAIRAKREAQGLVDVNGVARANVEQRDFYNSVQAWRDAGRPAAGLQALRAREADMRARGTF